jgi:hypothetical protein
MRFAVLYSGFHISVVPKAPRIAQELPALARVFTTDCTVC